MNFKRNSVKGNRFGKCLHPLGTNAFIPIVHGDIGEVGLLGQSSDLSALVLYLTALLSEDL
jgi:hypothetical protein